MSLIHVHAGLSSKAKCPNFRPSMINIHASHMQAVKVQASMHMCAGSREPSLLADGISAEILCTGPYHV